MTKGEMAARFRAQQLAEKHRLSFEGILQAERERFQSLDVAHDRLRYSMLCVAVKHISAGNYDKALQIVELPSMNDMRSTADIRSFLSQTLRQLREGEMTPSIARTHVQAARCFLDTVKVELAAAGLGKAITPVVFSESPHVLEHKRDDKAA